ncbi:MAG: 16S rRNA (guanine(527)-N(7))-methyltransferase RsmG [Granulosicoccus sp.]|nr:16S rRNA (guanine(527)-N(7))-methyltransferase RsmG [Granulosicoccus sp.]
MAEICALRRHLEQGLQQVSAFVLPPVNEAACDRLIALVTLLVKWNKVYNLTAVREPQQMIDRHLLDSLVMCRWLPGRSVAGEAVFDVMDVGTGAGFPVLPLALARPDLQFLSVESNGKKTRFQRQAMLELGIGNVTVMHTRIADVKDRAQLVISRAFAAPGEFLQIAETLCETGGAVAIMLGRADRLPVSVAPAYQLMEVLEIDVPGTESPRHVALCRRLCG